MSIRLRESSNLRVISNALVVSNFRETYIVYLISGAHMGCVCVCVTICQYDHVLVAVGHTVTIAGLIYDIVTRYWRTISVNSMSPSRIDIILLNASCNEYFESIN